MADVVAERDPVRGLQMRRALKSDEREDERLSWERQQQPLKQRQLELGVRSAERDDSLGARKDEVQGIVDEVAKMPLEAIKAYASQLNTNQSQLPFLFTGATKDGYQFVTIDPNTGSPTGKNFTLNEAQLRQLAAAAILGMKGFGQESLALIASVDKDIANIVERHNNLTVAAAKIYNDALSKQQQADQTGAYYRAAGRGRQSKEMNPATVKRLNDLSAQISAETDPTKRRALENEYNRVYSIAATEVGKVLPPRSQRVEIDPQKYAATLRDMMEVFGDVKKARMATDELFGVGAGTNDVVAGLKALNDKVGGITPPASTTNPAPAPAVGIRRTPRSGFEALHADASARLQAVEQALATAKAQLVAVARAGDPTAIRMYSERVRQLMAEQAKLAESVDLYAR
jgi:hypothetical protein